MANENLMQMLINGLNGLTASNKEFHDVIPQNNDEMAQNIKLLLASQTSDIVGVAGKNKTYNDRKCLISLAKVIFNFSSYNKTFPFTNS